jgi:hypothetical protein
VLTQELELEEERLVLGVVELHALRAQATRKRNIYIKI